MGRADCARAETTHLGDAARHEDRKHEGMAPSSTNDAGGALDAGSGYDHALDQLVGLGFGLATLYLVHGGRLRVMAARGRPVVRDGLPVHVDASSLGRVTAVPEGFRLRQPVRVRDRVVGLLEVVRRESLPHEDPRWVVVRDLASDLELQLRTPADPVSPVALRRFARHAVGLTAAATWDEAIAKLTDAALDLGGMSSAVVAVPERHDSAASRWRVCAAAGPLTPALAAAPSELYADLVTATGTGASLWSTGAGGVPGEIDAVPHPGAALEALGAVATCVVPLVAQGQRVGVVVLADEVPAHVAGTAAAEVLELLGALGAGALRTLDALQAVSDMATRDPLTGLGHHAAFFDDLRRALAVPGCGTVAVVTLDIDHFKQVNDTQGHLWGDGVLRSTAEAMSGVLRGADRAYRLGGDEFAAILMVEDAAHAAAIAHRVLHGVRAALLPVTVSLGVAVTVHGETGEALVGRADAALYVAKRAGRDGVTVAAHEAVTLRDVVGLPDARADLVDSGCAEGAAAVR